ncbi:MAG: fructose-1,6-bisphosphatase [Candidatus Promineifilaceae bacterium]
MKNLAYLELLAKQYPSIQSAATEIVALEASLNLPKETEHFLSDIHGAYEQFLHLLKSSSGSLRRRIDELFCDELTEQDRRALAALIYYPEQKLTLVLKEVEDQHAWYRRMLPILVKLGRSVSSKYTRTYIRQMLPGDFSRIIESLLSPLESEPDRERYYESLFESIVEVDQGREMTIALANLIQRLAITHLHIIGDIYDRGPGAHIILDELMGYHSLDIQWGNHDIVWMGAAAGSLACIANVIRISLRYNNMETLENGYGINLMPLVSLALDVYGDDPCRQFMPRLEDDPLRIDKVDETELLLLARMQKAISIIQFKVEGQIIQRRPHYDMENRLLLDKIDRERRVVRIGECEYDLIDCNFPTLIEDDPYALTEREQHVMDRLALSFQTSAPLQKHTRFLFSKGGMYRVYNNNLLYHGCISLKPDGTFTEIVMDGRAFSGKSYMDRVERLARQGYFATDTADRQYGQDVMWYLWSGARSPLYGKDKMATFERYFVGDKETHKELQNPYYSFRDDEQVIRRILVEFGVDPDDGCIINGHVPVKIRIGQSPVKANGKLIIIDGGMAKAYQEITGIAGFTLIANSRGMLLAEHKPFDSAQRAVQEDVDLESTTTIIYSYPRRLFVKDTDRGAAIEQRIAALKQLLKAYRKGVIKET